MTTDRLTPRFVTEISMGNLLIAFPLVVGLIAYFVKGDSKVDQLQHDLQALQISVGSQITDLKGNVTAQFAAVQSNVNSARADIAFLPDYKARLEQVERRLSENTTHNSEQDARIGAVERMAIQARSDLDNVTRASNAPIPGTRPR